MHRRESLQSQRLKEVVSFAAHAAWVALGSVEDAVGVIRQAFGCFDKEGKGFVSATDISRVLQESGEVTLSAEVSPTYFVILVFSVCMFGSVPPFRAAMLGPPVRLSVQG